MIRVPERYPSLRGGASVRPVGGQSGGARL